MCALVKKQLPRTIHAGQRLARSLVYLFHRQKKKKGGGDQWDGRGVRMHTQAGVKKPSDKVSGCHMVRPCNAVNLLKYSEKKTFNWHNTKNEPLVEMLASGRITS